MQSSRLIPTILLSIVIACILTACSNSASNSSKARLDLDDIVYDIETSGVAYDVKDNEVDYTKGNHYVVTMNVTNNQQQPVSFDRMSFVLIDETGRFIMPSTADKDIMSVVNDYAYQDSLQANESKQLILTYLVSGPGNYSFQITSPTTRKRRVTSLGE